MDRYPKIVEKDNAIAVWFGPETEKLTSTPIKMVLDFDRDGTVVGIEIINLLLKAGGKAVERINQLQDPGISRVKVDYDPECDAFYLRLNRETSIDQKSVSGTLLTDDTGQIIGLIARWN